MIGALVAASCALSDLKPLKLEETASRVIEARYPSLQNAEIAWHPFDDKFDFFRAQPRWRGTHRFYLIEANCALLKDPPSPAALEGVLAHELGHLDDYTRRSAASLAWLGLKYSGPRSWTARYERSIDEAAIDGGYGQGLKEYHLWLYRRLPPDLVALKKKLYYTPEEIDARRDSRSQASSPKDRAKAP